MSAAAWAMQKALYAVLSANAGLKTEIGDPPRIHDDPPPDAVFPYIVLNESRAAPLAGVDDAIEHNIRIEIISRHAGRREVKRLIDVLYDALHDADFAVEGHHLVNIRFVFGDVFARFDLKLYRGVARFRAVTQVRA